MGLIRLGLDLGGTKMEIAALDAQDRFLLRERIATPRSYDASIRAIVELTHAAATRLAISPRLGVAIPGSVNPATGLVRNANSTWLNARPLAQDLAAALGAPVRLANDANCFALSEAIDGAGAGANTVFGAILGTGCGGGVVIGGRLVQGANGIAGEWGHTPLPWMTDEEFPGVACWCGRRGCLETFISGTGLARDHRQVSGRDWMAEEIDAAAQRGDALAQAALTRHCARLARALAVIADVLDPDVIVLGGGLSNLPHLYADLPRLIASDAFCDAYDVSVRPAHHGDSSGVRGAARLWERET
jgi:fructokinase